MTTVDPNATIPQAGTASQPIQTSTPSNVQEEFDLGITQETSLPVKNEVQATPVDQSVSLGEQKNVSSGFDFSLDLPDAYASEPETNTSSLGQPESASLQTPIEQQKPEVENFELQSSLEENKQENTDVPLAENSSSMFQPQNEGESLSQNEEKQNPDTMLFAENPESSQEKMSQDTNTQSLNLSSPGNKEEVPSQVADFAEKKEVPLSGKTLNLDEMISQFSGDDQDGQVVVQSEMDPFNAMKATLEAQHEKKEKIPLETGQIVSSESSNQPELEEEVPVPVEEVPVPVEEVPVPVEEVPVPVEEVPVPVEEVPVPVEEVPVPVEEVPVPVEHSVPQTLDLDSLTAIPSVSAIPQPTSEIASQPIPSAEVSIASLTSPTQYPQNLTQKKHSSKLVGVIFGGFAIVLAGVVLFIRYPDLFNMNMLSGETTSEMISSGALINEEHGSAPEIPLTEDTLTGEENIEDSGNMLIEPTDYIDVTEEFTGIDNQDIQTIDLTEGSESTVSTGDDLTVQDNNDSLSAVEDLVGPINDHDFIKQEIEDYQRRGIEMKDLGTAQNNRTMMKYGLAVEKEAQKLLDQLANGENIDISIWSSQKAELDGYLAKATNV